MKETKRGAPRRVVHATGHRPKFPFKNPNKRVGRPRAHFEFGVMEVSAPSAKRGRGEDSTQKHGFEAEMIPGVDGKLIFGFPNAIITTLRYCTSISLVASAGASAIYVFSANSLFDPDVTGVGHQPMYRDQYAALYENYVVLGSKITVEFVNHNTGSGSVVSLCGDNDTTIVSALDTRSEQSNCITSAMAPASKHTLFMTFSPEKHLGTTDTDAGITAVGSSPSNQWFYGVAACHIDSTSSLTTYARVEIEYTVKFTELVSNGGS